MLRPYAIATLLFLVAWIPAAYWQTPFKLPNEVVTAPAERAALPAERPGTAETLSEGRTAEILVATDAPGRDLIALTERLKLGGKETINPIVNKARPNYTVGTRHRFNVADVLNNGYFTINATIQVVTAHAYWYVQDGYPVNLPLLRRSAEQFETRIYPTTRRVFGSEASPGVDNDPRITVLVALVPGVGGYFSTADAYPKVVNSYSNERDMIYLAGVPKDAPGSPENYFESTLAHEFQHMVHWNTHPDRDVWLDEGCSEVASFVNGYKTGGSDYLFSINPDTQLNAWGEPPKNGAHYGASYLFMRYLMHRYGGENFISSLLKQEGLGVMSIDAAVKQAGNHAGFEGAFKDWVVANALNDASLAGGRYSYPEGGRAVSQRVLRSYPATRSDTVHQHAADYITLSGSLGKATITFKGNNTVRVIAAEPHSGGAFWYSNRRDIGDATLTREFDLSKVQKASLSFWAWYDIEDMFDYAYVEASTDGGRSWAILKGRHTTTDNPNGTSFGHGWTGKSGVATNSTMSPKWVEEQVDLSHFAGNKVLVRFEYITDEGYNRPGFAVDDLRVPEIGYSDGAEADNAWTPQGFVRIGPRVPQRWFVALVEKGNPNRVREMVVDANGSGTLDLTGIGRGTSTRQAILVVAPLAPKTTEVANYTVTVKRK